MKRVYLRTGINGMGETADVWGPNDYWNSMEEIAPGITQVTSDTGWDWESILNNTTEFLQALVITQQQRDLIKANLERAKMGLPPLNSSEVGMGLSVGVDANTRQMLMLFGGGALLVAAFAVYSNSRRGR